MSGGSGDQPPAGRPPRRYLRHIRQHAGRSILIFGARAYVAPSGVGSGRAWTSNAHLASGQPDAAPEDRLRPGAVHLRHHAFPQPRGRPGRPGGDARGGGLAQGGDPLPAGHRRVVGGIAHAYRARAVQAGAAHHAADADLGAAPDRPRARHPVPAAPAHRQHAHCARRLRRRGQLPLRAGTAVAGERRLAEHAAADRVAARLHRHPFLAAAVPALSRPAAGAAVRCHRPAAGCARRLHGVGAHGRLLDRGCAHARQGERADALAERGRWRQPRALPLDRALRLRRHPAVRRPVHVRALHRAEPAAEECHHLHRRPDRAGAGGADAAGDQPQAQDPARVRVRRPRPLLHLPRAHRFRCQRAHAARLSRGHHARQHRRPAQRAPRLPGPARRRADRDAPAAAGQHRAQGRRPAGARTRPASRSRWR